MPYTELVLPGMWRPIRPTEVWVRVKADLLNEGRPVEVVVIEFPLQVIVADFVPGIEVRWGPPPTSEYPQVPPSPMCTADPPAADRPALPRRVPGESLDCIDVTPYRAFGTDKTER